MCRSRAEGGQRCSAHTRARLTKATNAVAAATATGDPDRIAQANHAWDTAAVEHASTLEGRRELREQARTYANNGDEEAAANHTNVIRRGRELAAANRAAAEAIRAANTPEALTARDIEQGRYTLVDNYRAVQGSPRFTCETHNQPGSCEPGCTDLVRNMSEGYHTVEFDPTGTTYGPERPYARYEYDPVKKASVEYIVTPIDSLDDTSYDTVTARLSV